MAEIEVDWQLVLIARLAQAWPGGYIGRTQLMKACYFLDVLREQPLPYRFTLYSYGPFDSDVLFDLGVAGNLGLVKEEYEPLASGYQYRITCVAETAILARLGGAKLAAAEKDIAWVVENFGACSASDIELKATIVYADQESLADGESSSLDRLVSVVAGVKPKFDQGRILAAAQALKAKGLLYSLQP